MNPINDYMNSGEVTDLDLAPRCHHYKMDGKHFVLKEASEGATSSYKAALLKGTEMTFGEGDTRKVNMSGQVSEAELTLVVGCLYIRADDSTLQPVPSSTIRGWPHRVVKELFNKVKEMSGDLSDAKETEESIGKEIAALQAKLAKFKKEETAPKEQPVNTTGNSV